MNIGPENSPPESFLAAQKPAPTAATMAMAFLTNRIEFYCGLRSS